MTIDTLNHRERQVLDCIAEGMQDKEIARRLEISPNTVRTYASRLFRKLGVNNRTKAAMVSLNHKGPNEPY